MPARSQRAFYALISEAVADLLQHGFDSQDRLDGWLRRIEIAARQSLVPPETLQSALRDSLMRIYQRTVEGGRLKQLHAEVSDFTLSRVKPKLRAELDRRILASANLIRLNREASIQRTLQRFAGWATSIPIGGSEAETRGEVGKQVRRSISGLPFEERRVIIDQGHKLVAAINDIVATDGGAIAAIWRHVREGGGYQARPEHEARDGKIFVLRDCWAIKDGLMKLAGAEYTDQVEQPGQLPFCRCGWEFIYNLRDLPAEMLTAKGKEALAQARTRLAG